MKPNKKFVELGIFLSLIFIAISFPLPYKFSNIALVSLLLFWSINKVFIDRSLRVKELSKTKIIILISFTSLFLLQIISLTYTSNVMHGFKNVESKLSLLIIPFIILDLSISREKLIQLLKYYVYSLVICTIILLLNSIYNLLLKGSLLTYHDFVEPLGFHAVFYSYCIFLSILISVYLISKHLHTSLEKKILIFSLVLSFVGLIISASKNVLAVTILFLVIGLVYNLLYRKIRLRDIVITLIIACIATISVSHIPTVKDRLKEIIELRGMSNYHKIKQGKVLSNDDVQLFNGTSLRILLWDLGINKLIDENKLLYGLSPGDRRDIMNNELDKYGLLHFYKNYNLHNQFIQTFVELGLIGLILYIILHILIIVEAIKKRNLLLLALIVGLVLFQMTESIIERNKGIVFYCFFLTLLLSLNSRNENRHIRH